MEHCARLGLARKIGVSNFSIQHLQWILDTATIKPSINQIEMHPYLQQPNLLAYLRQNNIKVQAFAPLTPLTKATCGPADNVCHRLATKYNVSLAAILLRWIIDQEVSVVTTSGNMTRLGDYLIHVSSFKLSAEEVHEISRVSKTRKFRGFFSDEFRELEKNETSLNR